ncbi:hypothetical protein TIFTF001_011836 [Ficus carica]|uniref:Uncharacterized protein n=1 Tax=Ficus carica TaxID=3494 RepID=A0AA87ZUW2_FICCA|nr:hypothetical protein TIFTF001_011836 [Ficus carica]
MPATSSLPVSRAGDWWATMNAIVRDLLYRSCSLFRRGVRHKENADLERPCAAPFLTILAF